MATIKVLMVNHCALLPEPAVSIVEGISLLLLYLSFILCFGNTARGVSKQPPRLVEKATNYRGLKYVLESPKDQGSLQPTPLHLQPKYHFWID